jgi:hypothetical protein
MKIPFTPEQFFGIFAQYNLSVWPMQVLLDLAAVGAVLLLLGARPWKSRVIAGILSVFWLWMAIAYHFIFFTVINPAAWLFGVLFLAGGLWFAWKGAIRDQIPFCLLGGARGWIGGFLIGFALILYPLLGYVAGHHYPAVPTFGLPCPTTIFTLGILLFAAAPRPRSIFAVPLIWAAIGSLAAFQLGVYQDLGLLGAGLIGLGSVFAAPAPGGKLDIRVRRTGG